MTVKSYILENWIYPFHAYNFKALNNSFQSSTSTNILGMYEDQCTDSLDLIGK
jgi:hypothetical protein